MGVSATIINRGVAARRVYTQPSVLEGSTQFTTTIAPTSAGFTATLDHQNAGGLTQSAETQYFVDSLYALRSDAVSQSCWQDGKAYQTDLTSMAATYSSTTETHPTPLCKILNTWTQVNPDNTTETLPRSGNICSGSFDTHLNGNRYCPGWRSHGFNHLSIRLVQQRHRHIALRSYNYSKADFASAGPYGLRYRSDL
jgi:hypothetical protein